MNKKAKTNPIETQKRKKFGPTKPEQKRNKREKAKLNNTLREHTK